MGNLKYINTKILIGIFTMIAFATTAAFAQAGKLGTGPWKLTQLGGKRISADSKAYIELDIGQARFTGSAGCNRMFGSVALNGRNISFSRIGTTRMACVDPEASSIETAFLKALGEATRYRQRNTSLELSGRNGVRLKFNAVRKDEASTGPKASRLEDAKWMLESIGGKRAGKAAEQAFVNFDAEKGSAGGNTGCNVFGGNYSTKDGKLSITDIISTMRACIEDDRMTTERDFLDGLRNAGRYEIKGGKLYLYQGEKLLLTFIGRN